MKTVKTQILRGAMSVVLASLALSCGPKKQDVPEKPAATPAPTKLTFSINSWVGWAPLFLAKEKGLFGTTQVEITRVEDTGARKSTMIAGHVDGYASSVDNFALDSAAGVPGKIVLCFDESFGGDGIVSKKTIKTPKDLRGKKVAFQKGLPSHFLLLKVLQDAGLSPQDVSQIDMDADKAGAAFTSGSLDAAVTWEPWISKAAAQSNGKILVSTKDLPGLIVDTAVFRDDVIEKKKSAIQDFVSGWFKALEYWKAHPEDSDQIMAKAYGFAVPEFQSICQGVRFYDLARNREYIGKGEGAPIDAVFSSASDLWVSAGIASKKSLAKEKITSAFLGTVP